MRSRKQGFGVSPVVEDLGDVLVGADACIHSSDDEVVGAGVAEAGLFVGFDAAGLFTEAPDEALDGVVGQLVEVAQDE
ncbi:hypothetical protein H5P28_17800, partial [Ruficoccus amylovorans]